MLDAAVPSTVDEKTGLPIHSLYGATRRPTPAMLAGLDAVVVDLQDVGARFYTYTTTMAYVMEAAAAAPRSRSIVLDRPESDRRRRRSKGRRSTIRPSGFTGYLAAMPIRHGLTLGELARLFNGERKIGADLTVVRMARLAPRRMVRRHGPAPGSNPSPNMRNLYEATLYPGLGAFERTNVSVGPRHRHAVRAASARPGSTACGWPPR